MPSTAETLLTVCEARVQVATNPTLYPAGYEPATIVVEKFPFLRDGISLPKLSIVLSEVADYEPATAEDDFAYFTYYIITFTHISKSNSERRVNYGHNEVREQFNKYFLDFYTNLVIPEYLPTLDDVNYRRKPVYDVRRLDDGYNYIPMTYEFKMQEAR